MVWLYPLASMFLVSFKFIPVWSTYLTPPPTLPCLNLYNAGTYDIHLSDGRIFQLFIPSGLKNNTIYPLIFNFHDYGSDNIEEKKNTDMKAYLQSKKWIGVYPQGTEVYDPTVKKEMRGFNAGGCCGLIPWQTTPVIDDIQYTRNIYDLLIGRMCIDQERVFATGFGNGAFMAHRIACQMDIFTGIAPHSGYLSYGGDFSTKCDMSKKKGLPIIAFHGIDDSVIPYGGDMVKHWLGFMVVMKEWAERLNCEKDAKPTLESDTTKCARFEGCKDNAFVEFCNITQLGHSWSGGFNDHGPPTHVNATDYIMSRFEQYISSRQVNEMNVGYGR